eukprot:gene6636-8209_t
MQPIEYLDYLKATYPDLSEQVVLIRDNYDNKLWHQLTKQLELFICAPQLKEKKELSSLYNFFIKEFESKLKPLSLVEISIAVAEQFGDNNEARSFIETISNKVKKDKSAYILSLSYIASMFLKSDQIQDCKVTIEAAKDELQGVTGLDTIVYSCFYLVCTDYYRSKNLPGEFYKNALMYLSYCRLETITPEVQIKLAYDLCVAALIGESVYSFGDLIVHPILKSLEGTPNDWLINLLKAFNVGDISKYEAIVSQHRNTALIANNTSKLIQKIAILALIDLAFRTPSDQRSIPFELIARTTKLPNSEIEHLLMKALSLELIKGSIDQIDQVVHISWVTPRILDFNQIETMSSRITEWTKKAKESLKLIEDEAHDLIV